MNYCPNCGHHLKTEPTTEPLIDRIPNSTISWTKISPTKWYGSIGSHQINIEHHTTLGYWHAELYRNTRPIQVPHRTPMHLSELSLIDLMDSIDRKLNSGNIGLSPGKWKD